MVRAGLSKAVISLAEGKEREWRKNEHRAHPGQPSVALNHTGAMRDSRRVKDLAERVGFEPTVQLPVLRFSRPVLSSTQPSLREWNQGCAGSRCTGYDRTCESLDLPAAKEYPALTELVK